MILQTNPADPYPTGQGSRTSGHRNALDLFFDPAGVAVIGASADPHKLSHGVVVNLSSHGYQGAVHCVNPKASTIRGLPVYPDIREVPDPVELAVLMVPAAACLPVLEACGQRGIKAAIVISCGFGEVGAEGVTRERGLLETAARYGMRLIGPNCVGTLDAYTGLNCTFIRLMPKPGAIGFISQSGAICGGILEWTADKGIGFSRFATVGNAADVSETDLVEIMAADPHTAVIVLYVEAIRDGRRFIDVASRVTRDKPILVLKAGTSPAGQRAVLSHTGSLAGEMAAYDAAFRQAGVQRVDTVEALFNRALALVYGPLPRGRRVAIVTNAGGPASLAADALATVGLTLPPTPPAVQAPLAQICSDAQTSNPVDLLGGAHPSQYEQVMRTLLADDTFDAVLPILVPHAVVDPVAVAEAISRGAQGFAKPVVACFMGAEAVRRPLMTLHAHRIAAYQFPEQAAQALGALWQRADHLARLAEGDARRDALPVSSEVVGWLESAAAAGHTQLGEAGTRPILQAYGLPQPQAELARTADEAAAVAARIGYPVALKIVSPDILHKSEVGGVVVNVPDEAAVHAQFTAMLARITVQRPGVQIEGVLVAEMAPPGYELIVGMRRDPQFGPLVMFGLGGIYVELLHDVAFAVAPLGPAEARRLIDATAAGKLLRGLRGQLPADIDAVVDVILAVAEIALAHPQIEEIDLNPLVAYPRGAARGVLAVDVRMVLRISATPSCGTR